MNTYKVFARNSKNESKVEIGTVKAESKKQAAIIAMRTNQNKWISVELTDLQNPKIDLKESDRLLNQKTVYIPIKESEISNTIVKELNAAVLIATFKNKGIQQANLCKSPNGNLEIVSFGNCIPVNSEIIDTILIQL
jgi:ribosomal protein S4E